MVLFDGREDPDGSFEYALVMGGFNGERYIEVLELIAAKANATFKERNAHVHREK